MSLAYYALYAVPGLGRFLGADYADVGLPDNADSKVQLVATTAADMVSTNLYAWIDTATAGGAVTLTLPDAATLRQGHAFVIKLGAGSLGATVDTDGGTIDGETSYSLMAVGDFVWVFAYNGHYYVQGSSAGSAGTAYEITAATYTADDVYQYLYRDLDTYGDLALTLPAGASTTLARLEITAAGATTRAVTIYGAGTDTIRGRSTLRLRGGSSVAIKYYNGDWNLL